MPGWTTHDIPAQAGRTAIVTGTGGLGYETALALTRAGAGVIIAGRNSRKGAEAVAKIRAVVPRSDVRFGELDLADLASVAAFAQRIATEHTAIDLLVNNAGVMTPPTRQLTRDGFELQFGTNYLGHFALTARLLSLLRNGRGTRVVNVSSGAHHTGRIAFDDLQSERRYGPWSAYSQSKLAMLMFAFELQRRSDAQGWGLIANAAHPGYARTELIANGGGEAGLLWQINRWLIRPRLSQSAADGALPTLFAATAPEAQGGAYCGPSGLFELIGPPLPARIAKRARDGDVAARLWQESERLTGVRFGEPLSAIGGSDFRHDALQAPDRG
jgi:NAD(P)-dependent dehydrogenase (short-subunit alcohol dehydrogenase family)